MDLEALYATESKTLLVHLTHRTADPQIALDLWAETFAQAYASRDSFRGSTDAEAGAWLHGIARNLLAQFYRRGTIEQNALRKLALERPPATPEVLAEVEREAGLQELRRDLAGALSSLTPALREAVQLRVVDELGYPEVAARLEISEVSARARVSRGLAALADRLDGTALQERTA